MSATTSEVAERSNDNQPDSQPLIIPVLPNDEIDPILPEPINAPSESDDQPSPDSINENPKEPKIIVASPDRGRKSRIQSALPTPIN